MKNLTIKLNIDTSEIEKELQKYKRALNAWIAVEEKLPELYVPVVVLTDGNYKVNPYYDKIKIARRHTIGKGNRWNNGFSCSEKVFYWAYLSDIPREFNKEVRLYQLNQRIAELEKI